MTFEESKILVKSALESKNPKQVKKILEKLENEPENYPGALEAIYSGITLKMSQLINK